MNITEYVKLPNPIAQTTKIYTTPFAWIAEFAPEHYIVNDNKTDNSYYLNTQYGYEYILDILSDPDGFCELQKRFELVECKTYSSKLTDKELDKRIYVNRPIITLCGSSKFKQTFHEVEAKLCLEGNIVLSVNLFGHADNLDVFNPETKSMLDDIHRQKIIMSDKVFVINVGGYIGESTRSEIEFATVHGIPVEYLENDSASEK